MRNRYLENKIVLKWSANCNMECILMNHFIRDLVKVQYQFMIVRDNAHCCDPTKSISLQSKAASVLLVSIDTSRSLRMHSRPLKRSSRRDRQRLNANRILSLTLTLRKPRRPRNSRRTNDFPKLVRLCLDVYFDRFDVRLQRGGLLVLIPEFPSAVFKEPSDERRGFGGRGLCVRRE